MSVLVGKKAPDFTVPAVTGKGDLVDEFNLANAIKGRYGLVFFYPLDFTFVCPSELIALDHQMEALKERNVEVIAVSIDSHYTHYAWRSTPVDQGGIGPVKFTIAADMSHQICRDYGVESEGGMAFRGAFIIDHEGTVRSQIVNDLPIGRNIDEIIRLIDAVQFTEEHGEVCPVNWQKGKEGMKATPEGVADYLSREGESL